MNFTLRSGMQLLKYGKQFETCFTAGDVILDSLFGLCSDDVFQYIDFSLLLLQPFEHRVQDILQCTGCRHQITNSTQNPLHGNS